MEPAAPRLLPLCDALAGLELAAGLVLLAEQEGEPFDHPLVRLRTALAEVHAAHELAAELSAAIGRPSLWVIPGRTTSATTTPEVA